VKEFKELNLKPELFEALKKMNFNDMTEVQEMSIPVVLQKKDLIVRSKTGSGKTGAFLVPIFQMIKPVGHPQALVIVPTRELAVQVSAVAQTLGHRSGMRIAIVYGGASINVQMQALRDGADIVIGTPGRIIDLAGRGALNLERTRFLVLDEADLMLDMGFIEDVEYIISMTPDDRQTILLSATMPRGVSEMARRYMKEDSVKLTIGEEEKLTVETITHTYATGEGRTKLSTLLAYIAMMKPKKAIIFTSTQRQSEFLNRFLRMNGVEDSIMMHGGMTQAARERGLREFKGHARFLISTNLASRGLDIPDISDIINFDAPEDPLVYVHRVGRSARMGKNGRAFTIFRRDQQGILNTISRVANVRIEHANLDVERFSTIKMPEMHERSERRSFGGGERRGSGGGGRRPPSHRQEGRGFPRRSGYQHGRHTN